MYSMYDKLHTDVVSDLFALEQINTANFKYIGTQTAAINELITFGEKFYTAIGTIINGQAKTINITPSEIREMGDKCRAICDSLRTMESTSGVIPIHIIRVIRELQTAMLLVANTTDIFQSSKLAELHDMWGD